VAAHPSIGPIPPPGVRYSSTYSHITHSMGYVGGGCYWTNNYDGTVHGYDITAPSRTLGWIRDLECPRGGLPDDGGAARPLCVCPAGHNFPPPPVNRVTGPWCVLGGPVSGCPVSDIARFGPPDPLPVDTNNLTSTTMEGLNCLSGCASVPILPNILASGYRPLPYQQHIADVWRKWKNELEFNDDPNCTALKAKISNEFSGRHQLGTSRLPPSYSASCHTSGACFDVNSTHRADIDRCSQPPFICRLRRPYGSDDPNHTVPY